MTNSLLLYCAAKGIGNNISADEYLYRDARNREIRMQQRVVEAQEEMRSVVNAKKINPKSAQLLKKRAVIHNGFII